MEDNLIYKNDTHFPPLLREIIPCPEKISVRGNIEPLFDRQQKILCIVGARKHSSYGKDVVGKLVAGLEGYPITIVSGLALGIDSIAHRSALDAKLHTIAIPGSGLHESVLYPSSHKKLAEEIVYAGGALISEFEEKQIALSWTFPMRNRLMAGISHATLVVEAEEKSGTLITSKFATDYNRDVGVVPGSIFSPLSKGPHKLMSIGAKPITNTDDLLELLGFALQGGQHTLDLKIQNFDHLSGDEKRLLHMLRVEALSRDSLIERLGLDSRAVSIIISSLELEGLIRDEGGYFSWA